MIAGCLSAASPCNHQKKSPNTICDVCQRSHDLTAETIRDESVRLAVRLLQSLGYTVTAPKPANQ